MKYAKIVDAGECMSTTQMTCEGVLANRFEWARHDFYPQDGMVGEVHDVNGVSVLKISDGIYVPMTLRGITEISREEYTSLLCNNAATGMNERQRRINDQYDSVVATEGYLAQAGVGGIPPQHAGNMDMFSYMMHATHQGKDADENARYQYSRSLKELSENSSSLNSFIDTSIIPALDADDPGILDRTALLGYLCRKVESQLVSLGYDSTDEDSLGLFSLLWVKGYLRWMRALGTESEASLFMNCYKNYVNL